MLSGQKTSRDQWNYPGREDYLNFKYNMYVYKLSVEKDEFN